MHESAKLACDSASLSWVSIEYYGWKKENQLHFV